MIIEFSFDDGYSLDLKLAGLLEKYGFTGVFYVPSEHDMTTTDLKKLSENHEIGGHTETHPMDIKTLSDEELKDELEGNKEYLDRFLDKTITKFCYPRGRYDDRVVQAVKDAGFIEARTTEVLKTDLPEDLFRKGTTIHCHNRKEYNGVDWYEKAVSEFRHALSKGDKGYFHVWGHSWEIDENNDWEKFEKLLAYLSI